MKKPQDTTDALLFVKEYYNILRIINPSLVTATQLQQQIFILKHCLFVLSEQLAPIEQAHEAYKGRLTGLSNTQPEPSHIRQEYQKALMILIIHFLKIAETLEVKNQFA